MRDVFGKSRQQRVHFVEEFGVAPAPPTVLGATFPEIIGLEDLLRNMVSPGFLHNAADAALITSEYSADRSVAVVR